MIFILLLLNEFALFNKQSLPQSIKADENSQITEKTIRELYERKTEKITIEKCSYKNIQDGTVNGGAVYIINSNIAVNDCSFVSCQGSKGGAIYIEYSGKTIYECLVQISQFTSCEAASQGGAIFINNPQIDKTITIDGCTFEQNKAATGGGIYATARDLLTIQGCTFTNNVASTNYASLYCKVGNLNGSDKNDTFILLNNKFIFTPSDQLTDVYIDNNVIQSTASILPPTVYIGGCTFSSEESTITNFLHLQINDAGTGYTAIKFNECNCVKGGTSTVQVPSGNEINNIDFECNSINDCTPETVPVPDPDPPTNPDENPDENPDLSVKTERELYEKKAESVTIEKCSYKNIQDSAVQGGAIYIQNSNITVNECSFATCKGQQGGAIYITYSGSNAYECLVQNSQFTSCSAGNSNGGAICINNPQINKRITIDGCKFNQNTAGKGGAINAIARDLLTIKGCTFTNNVASTNYASLYCRVGNQNGVDKDDSVVLLNNEFKFTASKEGLVNVYIENVAITDNRTSPPAVHIGGCTFSNDASSITKFYHLQIYDAKTGFSEIKFTECNCVQGGVETLSFPQSAYPVNNFHLNCNPSGTCTPGAPIEGPSVDVGPDEEGYTPHDRINDLGNIINLNKYKFIDHSFAEENGGAICISKNRVNCTLTNCKFSSCRAKFGGALYINYASLNKLLDCSITGCEFSNCEATSNGGAIFIQNDVSRKYRISISSCTFTSNKANGNGGAVYLFVRDNFTMSGCTFNNNDAGKQGSSVFCRAGYNTGNEIDNTIIFNDNTFIFTPKSNSINVYIYNFKVNQTTSPLNAVLRFGRSRFDISDSDVTDYKHLVIESLGDGFQSITFPDCICVKQSKETVTLPEGFTDSEFTYNCGSYGSCKPDSEGLNYHDRIEDVPRSEPINLENYKFSNIGNISEVGGAISINKNKVSMTLNKCKFDSCSGQMGGAIYILYSSDDDNFTCNIKNSIFINNKASSNGGAFYCQITQSNRHYITISYCTFISNEAGKNGGAIYAMVRDKFILEHSTFEDNIASSKDLSGCSLWCRVGWNNKYTYNTAIIRSNSFTFTPIDKKSVNVYIDTYKLTADTTQNANVEFGLNTFVARETTVTGYIHLKFAESINSAFESIIFNGCNCVQQGSETVVVPYGYGTETFNFNCQNMGTCQTTQPKPVPSPDNEGYTPSERIAISEGSTLRLSKSKFTNIESSQSGGALSLTKTSCSITDCKFATCKSNAKLNGNNDGGGAIYITYSGNTANLSASIISCQFTNCETTSQGGAMNIKNTQSNRHSINVEGCTFTGNKAANNGGAIYSCSRDLLTIQHCTFTNNVAVSGSSVWAQVGWDSGNIVDNQLVLFDNKFSFTPSDSNTVNVYIESNKLKDDNPPNANVFIGLCSFEAQGINGDKHKHLQITEKGAFQSIVFNDCNCIQGAQNTVTITSTVAPNTENLKFDCVNMDKCTAPDDSEKQPSTNECDAFSKNQEIFGKTLEIVKSCFYNLKSTTREGGAIRIVNSHIELEKCRFANCTCEKNGGDAFISYSIMDCKLEIEECYFENCFSNEAGGAVYFKNDFGSESVIEKCRFTNNKASSHGGALYYAPCSHSKLIDCLFVNNSCTVSANVHGSSVYALILNVYYKQASSRSLRKLDDDEDESTVVIEGNRIRSEPPTDANGKPQNSQQMYINLKKSGSVKIGDNAFSFNGVNVTTNSSKYIQVYADEGAKIKVAGSLCVDNDGTRQGLISGIDSEIEYDCHKADSMYDDAESDPPKKKKNVGMIVGIVVAVVVVIVIVVVVVVVVLRKKNATKYISDLNEDEIVDNPTADNEGQI